MASRIEFAVSATPICTIAAGTEYPAVDTLCVDVAKTLGSSGSVTCTWGTTVGYAAGSPAYVQSGANAAIGQTALTVGTLTSIKGIYIKNTGYVYSSSSVLGAVSAATVTVCSAATIAAATTIAILASGESIFLPFQTATTPTIYVAATQTGGMAVEVMATA
jgi:hypothetical protein